MDMEIITLLTGNLPVLAALGLMWNRIDRRLVKIETTMELKHERNDR